MTMDSTGDTFFACSLRTKFILARGRGGGRPDSWHDVDRAGARRASYLRERPDSGNPQPATAEEKHLPEDTVVVKFVFNSWQIVERYMQGLRNP